MLLRGKLQGIQGALLRTGAVLRSKMEGSTVTEQGTARGRGRAAWGAGAIVCAREICQKQRVRGNRPFAAVAKLGSCGQHLTQQRRGRAVQGVVSIPLQLEWLWQHHLAPTWMCAAQQQARCWCNAFTRSQLCCSPAG